MVIGLFVAEIADFFEDTKQATDLKVSLPKPLSIAFRVRKTQYQEKYGSEFTLRYKSRTGAKTELEKIMEGHGDWILYAFGEEEPTPHFTQWTLVDLDNFRYHMKSGKVKYEIKNNTDGSALAAYKFTDFPTDDHPIVKGRSTDFPEIWPAK